MSELIGQARKIVEGVTAGPWVVDDHEDRDHDRITVGSGTFLKSPGVYDTTDLVHEVDTYSDELDEACYLQKMADARFIAESRTLVPALADALHAAYVEIGNLHGQIGALEERLHGPVGEVVVDD